MKYFLGANKLDTKTVLDWQNDSMIGDDVRDSINVWDTETDSTTSKNNYETYRKYILKKWFFIIGCIILTFVTMGIALTIGEYSLSFTESYEILWNHIIGNVQNDLEDHIIVNLRMPRIITGILAGMGLAIAGAVMQSTLNNPLADPYTTGVSSGASFGATLAMTVGFSAIAGQFAVIFNAFIFALIPTALIIMVSKLKNASPTTMIMAGLGVMFLFNAVTTVMMLWADPNDLAAVYEWGVGTLSDTTWDNLPIIAIVVFAGVLFIQLISRKLNVLSTGDESAKALGVDADNLRTICLIVVGLVSAVIVSFTGLIGFVGLVAPHIVRLFIGPDNRYLIPACAAFGGMLLIVADLIGRTIISPATLQVGVVTAFIGGPLFIWLIIRKQSNVW